MSNGLGQSGGKVLVTFAPKEYDFVFFSHWFGGSAGDAKTACGAPFRLALLMWESPLAASTSPLSTTAMAALRDWAALSSCSSLQPSSSARPCDRWLSSRATFSTPRHTLPW